MTDKELSRELYRMAMDIGLCDLYKGKWGNPDRSALIDRWLHHIDYSLDHGYPSNDFIKSHFSNEMLHSKNVFVDEEVNIRNSSCIAVLNGLCKGTLLFDGFSTCDVYIRHGSDVIIDCSKFSKVFINVYDNAKVKVIQSGASNVYVYTHGENCVVETDGDIKIRKSTK